MSGPALYDFSPTLHVMLMGSILALGPLSWVWLRNRAAEPGRRWRALVLVTLFLCFDLVVFGAFTRLTDSGLGCPDWPGCYGHASPVGAQAHISAAQAAMPTGPVTHVKAWIEMIHRYLATSVGVLILTLAVVAWLERKDPRRNAPSSMLPWALASLVWVCIQGAFGALTVTMKLFPAIVTLHLLGGIGLLALLVMQAARGAAVSNRRLVVSAWLRRALSGGLLLVILQVALGGWVSTNYAVLACSDFPLCQGQWWPDMNLAQGFELWRPLGMSADGQVLSFPALTGIHFVHRAMAAVVLTVLLLLSWRMSREEGLRLQARALAGLAVLQVLTGISNVVFGWPMLAALAHTAGAAALVLILVWTLALTEGADAPAQVPSGASLEGSR